MLRRLVIVVLLALFALSDVAPSFLVTDVVAQEQPKKRRTLMDLLFGGDEEPPPPPEAPIVTTPKKAALPPVPEKPKVAKAENATRLAVYGDSMAVDVAKALERYYAEDPNLVVINQGVGSSGFVREDFFDWNKTAAEQVAANGFDIAVMIVTPVANCPRVRRKASWSGRRTSSGTRLVSSLTSPAPGADAPGRSAPARWLQP